MAGILQQLLLGMEVAVERCLRAAEPRGDGPVALADLAQQVLRLEVHQVQVAEQIEQRRVVVKRITGVRVRPGQQAEIQCDRILDTVVFAAIIDVLIRHGEPMAAVVV